MLLTCPRKFRDMERDVNELRSNSPAHASETFEWRIRQRSHARPAVQRGGSGGELLYPAVQRGGSGGELLYL